jgi:hypothetical protein
MTAAVEDAQAAPPISIVAILSTASSKRSPPNLREPLGAYDRIDDGSKGCHFHGRRRDRPTRRHVFKVSRLWIWLCLLYGDGNARYLRNRDQFGRPLRRETQRLPQCPAGRCGSRPFSKASGGRRRSALRTSAYLVADALLNAPAVSPIAQLLPSRGRCDEGWLHVAALSAHPKPTLDPN